MTPREQQLCLSLIITPPHGTRRISKEDFLRQFPSAVTGGKLTPALLEDAWKSRDARDLQCAMIVGHAFGFTGEHAEILGSLIIADWHVSHEDIVSALDKLRIPDTLPALFAATQWIPKYLEYDDCRSLATKAIWAIGKIPGPAAETRLRELVKSNDEILRNAATEQLELRGAVR